MIQQCCVRGTTEIQFGLRHDSKPHIKFSTGHANVNDELKLWSLFSNPKTDLTMLEWPAKPRSKPFQIN
jgi:hypothetical protein